MSCCIQFLKWNALSYFYSKNSFSKNIHYIIHLIFKNGINNIFPSQTSFLLLSSDTHASFANKPIKYCLRKPNTWRHIFAVVVYVLPSKFSYTTAFFLLSVFFPNSEGWRITPHHLLLYIFENLPQEFAVQICRANLPQQFAVAICRENMPQEFAGYLLREFAVAICRGIFVFVSKFFLVYVTKSCFYESKPFSYVSKTFLLLRFSLSAVFFCCCCCSGSYGPPHILL